MKNLKLTGGIIWVLESLYDTKPLQHKLWQLRQLENGTIGKSIADLLDDKGYRLIPKFENHDLKHVLLGYEMKMVDEIKMQAFLVGNGNYTFPCLIFLSLGIFYPTIWRTLPSEYKKGKNTKSVYHLKLDDCMHKSLNEVKIEFGIV